MKIITILLSLFLLLITDSQYVNNLPQYGYYIAMFGVIAIGAFFTISLLLRFWKENKTPFSFVVVCLMCGWIFISSNLQGAGWGPPLKYVFIILTAYYIAVRYDFNDIMCSIVNVLFVLATAAVLMWLIVFLFPNIYNKLPPIMLLNSSGQLDVYRTIGLANMYFPAYLRIPRLYSLFWEPGVAQAYFNIAIILSLKLIKGKKKILYISVFLLAVILTLSTTGYIVCAAILLYILLSKKGEGTSESKVISRIKIGVLIGVTVLLIIFPTITSTDLYSSVFGKLSEGMENSSVSSRVNSIIINLEIIRRFPLTGTGVGRVLKALYEYGNLFCQTNTVMSYFVTFGILIGTLYVLAWGSFIKYISHSTIELVTLCITFLLIFSGEDFAQSQFFNVLMMYGWVSLFDYRFFRGRSLKGTKQNEGKRE